MATKTKPTTDSAPYTLSEIFIDIGDDDRKEILELAGFEINANDPRQQVFIETIRIYLGRASQALAGIKNIPLPANVKAELDEISSLAGQLSERLGRQRLTFMAQDVLLGELPSIISALDHAACVKNPGRESLDNLCTQLAHIADVSRQVCLEIEANGVLGHSGGQKRKMQASLSQGIANALTEGLADFFRAKAPYSQDKELQKEVCPDLEGCLQDFLNFCMEGKTRWERKQRIN